MSSATDGTGREEDSAPALPLDTTVGHLIRRAQQVHTALWGGEFNGDLTGPQYALLSTLTQQTVLDQRSAGRIASLDTSTAADVVARLQRNGWLNRRKDPSDRRRYLLALTAPARTALGQITPRAAGIQRQLLEPLAPGDRTWFVQALARVAYVGQPPVVTPHTGATPALPLPTTPGHLIRRSEQLHGLHWARRVGATLTPSQYGMLAALAWNAPIDQGRAGELASLDKSSTAEIIARLLRRGLVETTPNEQDRRRKLVRLTAEARGILRDVTPEVVAVQRLVTEPLDDQEAVRLAQLLHAVAYR